jgi:hypothetical protein
MPLWTGQPLAYPTVQKTGAAAMSNPMSNAARVIAMMPKQFAKRPGMHFVPVKSVTQQAQGMVLKVRETLVG